MENIRFSFKYDGKPSSALPCTANMTENGNTRVTVFEYGGGLRITNTLHFYPAFNAYDWVNVLENTSDAPTGMISELYDGDFVLEMPHQPIYHRTAFIPSDDEATHIMCPRGCSEWSYYEFVCDNDGSVEHPDRIYAGQSKRYACAGGRSTQGFAPYFRIRHGSVGANIAIGWTGQWNAHFERSEDALRITTGIEGTHFRLLPGEKIRTSSVTVQLFDGEDRDRINAWRRFVKDVYSPIGKNGRDAYGPLCGGVWGGMKDEALMKKLNTVEANGLPYEYIWMDAGWYGDSKNESPDEFTGDWAAYTGDWRVNTHIHPNGLTDVSDKVHGMGKKFLLWFEPERVVDSRPIVKEHPEYFIKAPFQTSSLLLYLGNKDAWQYVYDTLCERIETLKIDFYRQDFNFEPLAYFRQNDAEDRQGITEIKHITGMYDLLDALMARFPHLLIDNCASGGRRLDVEMMRRSIPLWRSDTQCPANFEPDASQTHMLGFNSFMPYSGTGTGREWGDLYRLRSCYGASMQTNYFYAEKQSFGDDPEQIAWLDKYLREYLCVRRSFSEDFYALTEPTDKKDAWCAAEFTDGNEGIVLAFRREASPFASADLVLYGLDADKTYVFTDADTGETAEYSGKTLMSAGLSVHIAGRRESRLLRFKNK